MATFGSRPAENADPWYAAREAYDQSLEDAITANETAATHANRAVLDATTASFTTDDETKLDGIEENADVTDATNVEAAGAVMDTGDQTVAGVKTFNSSPIVPAPTTDLQAATKKYVDETAGGGGGTTPYLPSGKAIRTDTHYAGMLTSGAADLAITANRIMAIPLRMPFATSLTTFDTPIAVASTAGLVRSGLGQYAPATDTMTVLHDFGTGSTTVSTKVFMTGSGSVAVDEDVYWALLWFDESCTVNALHIQFMGFTGENSQGRTPFMYVDATFGTWAASYSGWAYDGSYRVPRVGLRIA